MIKNPYILKWFNREISEETAQQLLAADDFEFYKKLKSHTENIELVPTDLEANYAQIKTKKANKGIITLSPKTHWLRYTAIAASLALLFGLYQLFVFSNQLQSDFGSTKTFKLPDQSIVTLDANSEIEYPNGFAINRKLALNGTAYFEVEKGKVFTVKTAYGEVEVLGTKFEVITRPDWFEVTCFEGKVKVKSGKNDTILTPGKKIRIIDSQMEYQTETIPQPLWITGESGFKSVPFYVVLHALENQFGIQIQYPEKYKKVIFTGSFTHSDLDTAMKSICLPVNLQYNIKDSKVVLSETTLNQN